MLKFVGGWGYSTFLLAWEGGGGGGGSLENCRGLGELMGYHHCWLPQKILIMHLAIYGTFTN